eukprot:GHVN01102860.1.p1 GENE.GHVN01102860.1~~GHVN01102860.1.p1  ORF type:complete len:141 (+),score=28.83 GHVN01102860.1:25-447(+)
MSDTAKQLTIKTGIVERTFKELLSYIKEEGELRQKVEDIKADSSADSGRVKQAENCLSETLTVIPDTKKRLKKGCADLDEHVASLLANEKLETHPNRPQLTKAIEILAKISTEHTGLIANPQCLIQASTEEKKEEVEELI